MTIYADVIAAYPELESTDNFTNGTIILQNDSDGAGDFIAKWDYIKPIPQGMKLGK